MMNKPNELRLFISSTFRDLQEEREHLVKKIFPEIRALCRERGVTFTEVDLRWGLTEEEATLGRVIRTCLEEIDKCRPYFIGLVGERYGWAPELYEYYKDPELFARWPWLEDAAMEGASITDIEFRHGALNNPEMADKARFYIRDLNAWPPEGEVDSQLHQFRDRVYASGLSVVSYADAVSLGGAVLDDLRAILDQDFAETQPASQLQIERAGHEAFSASRRHAYIPNTSHLRQLDQWFTSGTTPLVVSAESGSGKSSLLAFWCEQRRRRDRSLQVIELYVGLGSGDSAYHELMRTVMGEIKERFGRQEEIPTKPEELEQEFGNWLGFGLGTPILLVLDGLDQLGGRGRDLYWLPPMMPEGLHLVVSSTPTATLDVLQSRSWQQLEVAPLSEPEREAVIVRFLAEYRKALSSEQVRQIATNPKSSHPLFLRTLLEELRLSGEHEQLQQSIDRLLQVADTDALFEQVLERFEADHSHDAVQLIFSLLWLSRDGLDEEQLIEISQLPRLELSSMILGLDYHLLRRGSVLSFFHNYLRRAVERRYLGDKEVVVSLRERIVDHVEKRIEAEIDQTETERMRTAREIIHQIDHLGDPSRLAATLSKIPVFAPIYQSDAKEELLVIWARLGDQFDIEELYRQSLQKFEEKESKPSVLLNILGLVANLFIYTTRWEAAAELLQRCEKIARDLGDRLAESESIVSLVEVGRLRGNFDEVFQLAERQEAIHREIDDPVGTARILGYRGMVLTHRGTFAEALATFEQQEAIYRRLGNRVGIARAVGNKGIALSGARRFQEAISCYQEQIRLARELGDRITIARTLGNLGLSYAEMGDPDKALELYDQQEEIARELGDRRAIAMVTANRATIYRHRGLIDRSLENLAKTEAIYREIGDRTSLALVLSNMAQTLMAIGELETALRYSREQEQLCREIGDRRGLAIAIGQLGNNYFARNEYSAAYTSYQEWRTIARELGDERMEAMATGNLGLVASIRGDIQESLELQSMAMQMHRQAGDRHMLRYWLIGIAEEFLEMLELQTVRNVTDAMPEYLANHLDAYRTESKDTDRTNPDTWRQTVVAVVSELTEEFDAIGVELSLSNHEFNLPIIQARLAAARGEIQTALSELETQLVEAERGDTESDDDDRATLRFYLWRLSHSYLASPNDNDRAREEEHRRKALELYRQSESSTTDEVLHRIAELTPDNISSA